MFKYKVVQSDTSTVKSPTIPQPTHTSHTHRPQADPPAEFLLQTTSSPATTQIRLETTKFNHPHPHAAFTHQ